MSSFNKVVLMGNLTRDPETRYTQNQNCVCKTGIAVDSGWGDNASTTFVDVTIFGKRGEAFSRYMEKGSLALVEGELRLDTWEDKNSGQKRQKLYVVANSWEFCGGDKPKESPAEEPADAPLADDDNPW